MGLDLFVIRHAAAFERDLGRWPDDADRPLTPEGERDFARSARGLARVTDEVEAVLASPYARAWRTAELLHEEGGWPEPRAFAPLEADRHAEQLLADLAKLGADGSLAVVGHEPMLGVLSGILVGGGAFELKKGAVVRLDVSELRPGGATLRWLLPPKVLRGLAK
jgi:phosphohistidine phosphatase